MFNKIFETPVQFSLYIEDIVQQSNLSHMEAVLKFCEDTDVDPAEIKPLISQTLKDRIRVDMQNIGMIPQGAQLDM